MPRYTYIAISADGKKAKGTITAENPFAARKQLRVRNIHPTSINPELTPTRQIHLRLIYQDAQNT